MCTLHEKPMVLNLRPLLFCGSLALPHHLNIRELQLDSGLGRFIVEFSRSHMLRHTNTCLRTPVNE